MSGKKNFITKRFAAMITGPIFALPMYLWYDIHYNGKKEREQQVQVRSDLNYLQSYVCSIPHAKKKLTGGEDAYVLTADGSLTAVADGVGGWKKKGVDPAEFSNELCNNFK